MQRCKSDTARHAFVFQSRVCGPNAFVDCSSTNDYATSEPHHRWSVGGLYDNVHSKMAFQDRQYMGSGHGWAGANYVAWNCEGTLVCQRPPTAQNWAIGFVGTKEPGAFEGRADGYWESLGKHVEPRSLYQKQLEDRNSRGKGQGAGGEENTSLLAACPSPLAPIYAMQLPASAKEKPAVLAAGNQLSIENKFIRVTDIG